MSQDALGYQLARVSALSHMVVNGVTIDGLNGVTHFWRGTRAYPPHARDVLVAAVWLAGNKVQPWQAHDTTFGSQKVVVFGTSEAEVVLAVFETVFPGMTPLFVTEPPSSALGPPKDYLQGLPKGVVASGHYSGSYDGTEGFIDEFGAPVPASKVTLKPPREHIRVSLIEWTDDDAAH